MNATQIKSIQTKIGVKPDGIWGPKSKAVCMAHLRNLMPQPHPFPAEAQVTKEYGPHGVPRGSNPPMIKVDLPYEMFYEGKPVRFVYAHIKVAPSLARVFRRLHEKYPTQEDRKAAGIDQFDGLYNPRKKRGGTSWSMHSWAIAIDLNAAENGNLAKWPQESTMPFEVMECFASEGWFSAGAFWGRDAMHFQATRP